MARKLPPSSPRGVKFNRAYPAIAPENNSEPYALNTDWLIDSGCTTHMTPEGSDFVGPLEEYHTLVEIANGAMVEVSKRGTVKLRINDFFRRYHYVQVYLNNVLWVPNLNRRLMSVAEWNQCGGQALFLHDRV